MSDPLPDNKPPEEKPAAAKSPVTARPARRPSAGAARKAPGETKTGAPPSVPPAPDRAKTIAFALCGLLLVGIVALGGYLIFRPKTVPVVKPAVLSTEAKELAEMATRGEELYKAGTAKAAGDKLEDWREADEKLTEANKLFNQIVDKNQTLEGFKEQINLARAKKESIDKELLPLRTKIKNAEDEERVKKSKASQTNKAPDTGPPPPSAYGKEPTPEQLTDENLERLFKNDPSEYERLAKIRKAKDPTYVIKKEE